MMRLEIYGLLYVGEHWSCLESTGAIEVVLFLVLEGLSG
jgi:hypothetical protein